MFDYMIAYLSKTYCYFINNLSKNQANKFSFSLNQFALGGYRSLKIISYFLK